MTAKREVIENVKGYGKKSRNLKSSKGNVIFTKTEEHHLLNVKSGLHCTCTFLLLENRNQLG